MKEQNYLTVIRQEIGKKISNKEKWNLTYFADKTPNLMFLIRLRIPFSYGYTKNQMWRMSTKKGGYIFLRKEARELTDYLILAVKQAIKAHKFYQNKVWIDILVQKPNARGDAINFVDSICDAIKKAIEIDDRWFSLRRVDWQIIKDNPEIYIGIGQEEEKNVQICSYCGRLLDFEKFTKNKSEKFGIARECKECVKIRGKIKRLKKLK